MKFIRLTSVFLCCALLSSFLILSASAVDDNNYYSLPPVAGSDPSVAIDWPVMTAGEYDSILNSISRQIGSISSQINDVTKNQVTLAQMLSNLSGIVTNNGKTLSSIFSTVSLLSDKVATESTLFSISSKVATEDTLSKVATESTLSAFSSAFQNRFGFDGYVSPVSSDNYPYFLGWTSETGAKYGSWGRLMEEITRYFGRDDITLYGTRTLYGRIAQMQEVLASDDDKELAESQKQNREQIEQDFLSGSSGKTSLGKDDFGSLSSVGGTFKDTISLNGQSSLSDLTSGLSDADTAGQGWFSQATKDSLDAVSGSGSVSTVSTFSDDGLSSVDVDPDPYHMQGFEDNYAWLWGDD